MKRLVPAVTALALAMSLLVLPVLPAIAMETVTLLSVGSSSANFWPTSVAVEKGFFKAADLQPDIVFAQSNAAVIQQEVQAPPYSLLAKPGIKSIGELKGKMVSVGGAKDITRIFVERMLEPNGVKPGEFDMTFAGATSARFSALQAGAVDAAILTPPFNFHAQSAGFTRLGDTVQYVDMPFAGISVNTNWAASNKATVLKVIEVYNKSMAWLYDPANRDEAVQILMKVSKIKQSDVELAYDFLIKGKYLEATGKVSRSKLGKLVAALKELGDIPQDFSVDR